MKIEAQKKPGLDKLFRRLSGISRISKCSGCSCLMDTLREFQEASKGTQWEEKASEVARQIKATHGCLGCNPCYPVAISNALYEYEMADQSGNASSALPKPCETLNEPSLPSWPVAAGDYLLGSPLAPVAVSTLGSTELPSLVLREALFKSLAIIGKTETENIGIDKVIKNTITNPAIRFLLLAGQDPEGHYSGKTLLALWANGVNEGRRVIGSPGKRPILKNTTRGEVEAFRKQVQVVDMIGCEDVGIITEKIRELAQNAPVSCDCSECAEKAKSVQASISPVIQANKPAKAEMDKAGYFVVIPQTDRGIITVEHYSYANTLLRIIEGKDAASIYQTIIENGWVTQLSHAAYIGKELTKAELSLKLGFKYIQDGA